MGLRKRSRTRVLDYREIRAFLAAPQSPRRPIALLPRTDRDRQRIGEVSRMRWSYIDLEMRPGLYLATLRNQRTITPFRFPMP